MPTDFSVISLVYIFLPTLSKHYLKHFKTKYLVCHVCIIGIGSMRFSNERKIPASPIFLSLGKWGLEWAEKGLRHLQMSLYNNPFC